MITIAFDIGIALCSAATAYALVTLIALFSARVRYRATADVDTPVSILKPLRGDEPRLYENLRSFCLQDYPAFELLFGVRDAADPALAVARRLKAEFPELDITVLVDARLYGDNPKVSNLANLAQRARHPWMVVADSDIGVGRDYLRRVCAPLLRPDVGVVTCLYHGRPVAGLWARLGALYINEWFVPAVRIAQLFGSHAFGFGATLALRRETLDAIGGFRSIADELADDYRLAERARDIGLATVLSDYVVTTDVAETSARQLVLRELRWMRTIRMLNPVGYACMLVSFGPVVGTIGAALAGWASSALVLLAITCLARAALHLAVAPRAPHRWWNALRSLPLVVVRDALNVVVWGAAFGRRVVAWAGCELQLR